MNTPTIAKIVFRHAITVLVLLNLAACATTSDVSTAVEEFFHEDPSRVGNALATKRGSEGLEFTSYGRAGGTTERLVIQDDLIELWTLTSDWGTLTVVAMPDESLAIQEGFTNHKDGVDALLDAFDTAMHSVIGSLPAVAGHGVNINILAAFTGSGRAIRQHHRVDAGPLAFAFVTPLGPEGRGIDSPGHSTHAAQQWAGMLLTVAHELLHVEHQLQDLRLNKTNSETAATLFERCALSRFATTVGGELKFEIEDMSLLAAGFPGLEDGVFAPRVRRFPSKNATLRGQHMAAAWLVHYTNGQPLVYTDPEAVDRMLKLCDRLAVYVPDFVNGETGLESLE